MTRCRRVDLLLIAVLDDGLVGVDQSRIQATRVVVAPLQNGPLLFGIVKFAKIAVSRKDARLPTFLLVRQLSVFFILQFDIIEDYLRRSLHN